MAVAASAVLHAGCDRPPAAVQTPELSPTPTLDKERAFQDVVVAESTVTVSLRVFAGIDIKATLDGQQPDEVRHEAGVLRHVFRDVAAGAHAVRIRDVMGFSEILEVVVPPP